MLEEDRQGDGRQPSAAETRRRVDLLYRDQAQALKRRLQRRLGSSEEATDMVHEAFARLLRTGPLDRLRAPEAFLSRIVRNLLIDRSRRAPTRAEHVGLDETDEVAIRAEQGDMIELEQLKVRYRAVVDSLPGRTRQVFVLHRVEGLRYKEIAGRLGISVRTVEWHFAQAIVRINRGLEDR